MNKVAYEIVRLIISIILLIVVISIYMFNDKYSHSLTNSKTIKTINADDTLNNYYLSYEKSKKIEDIILKNISNEVDFIYVKEIGKFSNDFANKLSLELIQFKDDIKHYIDDTTYEEENRNKKSKLEMLKEYTKIHYFLDSNTGELIQTFIFYFPNGNISRIELNWMEGECVNDTIFSNKTY
ncbi:hypothetical protein [Clostridioides sp. ZZV15-6597]|uniref:hypothetical protein n=1 Tax=Clostridioides sp. ZZV15-6597 TaxID=2811500 RepID=UPI001D112F31|nr:hypothetical protein [Clostridioides sp. ZZV15-6597]HBF1820586.1 hypothetical protein [Clostridioides difficile]